MAREDTGSSCVRTLDDPKFDGKSRVKRTTGIPRSFLKTVAKPELDADGNAVGGSDGGWEWRVRDCTSGYTCPGTSMLHGQTQVKSDDIYTQHVPEEMSDAKCPYAILMRKATKTPCCGKTYCEECVQQALLDSDLVCPGCGTPETLLDALGADDDLQARISAYVKEHESNKRPAEQQEDKEEEERRRNKCQACKNRAITSTYPPPATTATTTLYPIHPFMMPNPMQMMMMGMPMPPPPSPNPKNRRISSSVQTTMIRRWFGTFGCRLQQGMR